MKTPSSVDIFWCLLDNSSTYISSWKKFRYVPQYSWNNIKLRPAFQIHNLAQLKTIIASMTELTLLCLRSFASPPFFTSKILHLSSFLSRRVPSFIALPKGQKKLAMSYKPRPESTICCYIHFCSEHSILWCPILKYFGHGYIAYNLSTIFCSRLYPLTASAPWIIFPQRPAEGLARIPFWDFLF